MYSVVNSRDNCILEFLYRDVSMINITFKYNSFICLASKDKEKMQQGKMFASFALKSVR